MDLAPDTTRAIAPVCRITVIWSIDVTTAIVMENDAMIPDTVAPSATERGV